MKTIKEQGTAIKWSIILFIILLMTARVAAQENTADKEQEPTKYYYQVEFRNIFSGARYEVGFNDEQHNHQAIDDKEFAITFTAQEPRTTIAIKSEATGREPQTYKVEVGAGGKTIIRLPDTTPREQPAPQQPREHEGMIGAYRLEEEYFTRNIDGKKYHYYRAEYTSKELDESISHACTLTEQEGRWIVKHYVSLWHDGPCKGTPESVASGAWDLWSEIDYEEPLKSINPSNPESVIKHFRKRCYADHVCFERGLHIKIETYTLEGLPGKTITMNYNDQ